MRTCSQCGQIIPAVRIAVLPNTECCVGCSMEKPRDESEIDLDGAAIEEKIRSVCHGRGSE